MALDDRVHRLTENLEGTNRNLKSLDRMLDQYRDVGRDHRHNVDRLRDDVGRTHQMIRDERLRDYGSDSEYEVASPISRRRRKPRRSTLRFADDMNKELHSLHHAVRDLSSDHLNLETSFNREVDRRDGYDMDTRRKIREISDDLKRFTSSDPVADRVERRLRMIQSELEADRLVTGRNEELCNLSMELRNALQQQQAHAQQSAIEERVRSSYLQNETQRHRMESDLDEMRRKLDMAEGSKSAMQQQVDDLRNQLRRMESDRSRMKSHMEEARLEDELRERRKRRSMEEDQKKNLERELLDLRQQMARSIGATSETEELRRGLEKSERQRVQLSDHIETITKDLENREKQTAKLINELKSVSDKCEDVERHKNHLMVQVEDTTAKLRDNSRELDKALTELRNTQLALADAEKKRDEFKGRAQETVRQWKMKVKQLERELDRHKHGNQQMMQRNEQLVKEMEGIRQQGHTYGIQLENMRRELGDALAVRAAQDEQIRLKDVEINELKSLRMDLDRELRDTRTVSERLENELHNAQSRIAQVSEERNRLEDRLSAVEAAHCLAQDQAAQLQDLRQSYIEMQHREKAAREESKLVQKQLQDERDNSRVAVETLKRELNEAKVREAHVLQDLQRKLKKDKAEYEAAIQALKMELSEDKSSLKISKRNEEKYRKEAEILQQGMNRFEEENQKLLSRLDHTKKEYEAQSQINESDMSRFKKLEDEIFHMNSDLKKSERKYENLAQDMISEVDALMDIMSTGCIEKFKTVSAVKGALNGNLLADLKIKMKWLRNQIREKIKYEQKLRKDIRDALTANEGDRKYLLQELARREEVLDELAAAKQELAQREIENLHCVEVLEKLGYFEKEEDIRLGNTVKDEKKDHILDLTDELELRKIRESETHKQHEYEKHQIITDIEGMRDKEKARIEERYIRLQDTMRALQNEIKVANLNHQQVVELEKNIENARKSPGRKKVNNNNRVRIHTPSKSPHRRPQTPPSRLPKGHDDSIAPMEMSDEQFSRKFARRKSIEDGVL
ncbi:centrosomal protein of 128 kDa-like isoform X3 [Mercenaria mercenaria]|uniref:centrosomal protein of 128 kDa-like isoform X3 n=1 Tax=Mercenaria mercenaria TaxID=6596 RepID=UPI00234F7F17|nr:centrosomal protein of 128 kDa-like isoform X3 [Mercenaria mercenaria]